MVEAMMRLEVLEAADAERVGVYVVVYALFTANAGFRETSKIILRETPLAPRDNAREQNEGSIQFLRGVRSVGSHFEESL